MFSAYPEDADEVSYRKLLMFEHLNKRTYAESDLNKKRVCFLLITHGTFVDEMANIFKFIKKDQSVPPIRFPMLDYEVRQEMLKSIAASNGSYLARPYKFPTFCSISGFKVDGYWIKPTFSRMKDHLTGL